MAEPGLPPPLLNAPLPTFKFNSPFAMHFVTQLNPTKASTMESDFNQASAAADPATDGATATATAAAAAAASAAAAAAAAAKGSPAGDHSGRATSASGRALSDAEREAARRTEASQAALRSKHAEALASGHMVSPVMTQLARGSADTRDGGRSHGDGTDNASSELLLHRTLISASTTATRGGRGGGSHASHGASSAQEAAPHLSGRLRPSSARPQRDGGRDGGSGREFVGRAEGAGSARRPATAGASRRSSSSSSAHDREDVGTPVGTPALNSSGPSATRRPATAGPGGRRRERGESRGESRGDGGAAGAVGAVGTSQHLERMAYARSKREREAAELAAAAANGGQKGGRRALLRRARSAGRVRPRTTSGGEGRFGSNGAAGIAVLSGGRPGTDGDGGTDGRGDDGGGEWRSMQLPPPRPSSAAPGYGQGRRGNGSSGGGGGGNGGLDGAVYGAEAQGLARGNKLRRSGKGGRSRPELLWKGSPSTYKELTFSTPSNDLCRNRQRIPSYDASRDPDIALVRTPKFVQHLRKVQRFAKAETKHRRAMYARSLPGNRAREELMVAKVKVREQKQQQKETTEMREMREMREAKATRFAAEDSHREDSRRGDSREGSRMGSSMDSRTGKRCRGAATTVCEGRSGTERGQVEDVVE